MLSQPTRALLTTVHGSHLYGLDHQGSDLDTYSVILGRHPNFARQVKRGDDDQMTLSLNRFAQMVESGVPQALEALWSPSAMIDPDYRPYLSALRPGFHETRMRYRRTILNFAFGQGGRTGSAAERVNPQKLRRHALRLALNLADYSRFGRFNPSLTPTDRLWVLTSADDPDFESILRGALDTAMWSGADQTRI